MMRGRRFINYGTVNLLPWINQRKPFFDNDVIELVFSLPDEYRQNNGLYSSMLQKYFPAYFRDIPWQQTGRPAAKINTADKIKNKMAKMLREFMGVESTSNYTDYPSWIREKRIADQLGAILGNEEAAYKTFSQEDFVYELLSPHLETRNVDNSIKILRAATIEFYLKELVYTS